MRGREEPTNPLQSPSYPKDALRGWGASTPRRKPPPLVPTCPIMDVGLKGGPFRDSTLAYVCVYMFVEDADIVWFTSLSVVSQDSFASIKRQAWFRGSIFVYSAISPPLPSPTRFTRQKRLSTIHALLSFLLLSFLVLFVDALISLRSSWSTGCRPNKVWRDRWEKFLRLKSGGFSPVYPPSLSLFLFLFESRGLPSSKKIWENGGSLSQFSFEQVILSLSVCLVGYEIKRIRNCWA